MKLISNLADGPNLVVNCLSTYKVKIDFGLWMGRMQTSHIGSHTRAMASSTGSKYLNYFFFFSPFFFFFPRYQNGAVDAKEGRGALSSDALDRRVKQEVMSTRFMDDSWNMEHGHGHGHGDGDAAVGTQFDW